VYVVKSGHSSADDHSDRRQQAEMHGQVQFSGALLKFILQIKTSFSQFKVSTLVMKTKEN
jgi:hypothetical protein